MKYDLHKKSKYDLHNHARPPLCLYMMAFSLVKYDLQKEKSKCLPSCSSL